MITERSNDNFLTELSISNPIYLWFEKMKISTT